jgi:simple sugar transport system ATP-binding protein
MDLLQLRGITKRFLGVTALSGVDFTVRAGEVHALLGENGAGKSTLIKVLTGVHPPDAGTIVLGGERIAPQSPKDAERAGISTVYQEVNLIPGLSVAENIALGRQPGRFGFVNWRAVRRHAREALARLEIDCEVDAELGFPWRCSRWSRSRARSISMPACSCWTSRPRVSTKRRWPSSFR